MSDRAESAEGGNTISTDTELTVALAQYLRDCEAEANETLGRMSPTARAFCERWQADIRRAGRHHATRYTADVWLEFVKGVAELI